MSALLSTFATLFAVLVTYNVRMTLIAIAIALPVACLFAVRRGYRGPGCCTRPRRRTSTCCAVRHSL